jgi:hypothetical protein
VILLYVIAILRLKLQIALTKKFLDASTYHTIKFGSLETDENFPITYAERFDTRFGPALLLSIRHSELALKVFLPRRYSEVVTEECFARISSNKEKHYLVYSGVCTQTSGYLQAIKREEDKAAE